MSDGGQAGGGWRESGCWGACLLAAYVLFAALPLGLAFVLSPATGEPFLEELGRGAGMLGFALLALQVALGSRLKLVDGPFGLDVVLKFHKGMALVALGLLLVHPAAMALAEGNLDLFGFGTPWTVNLGKLALLLLVLTVLLALLARKFGLQYQRWHLMHKAAILIILVGFAHGLLLGPDLRPAGMRLYWWSLLAASVGLFTYRNLYVPLWGARRFRVRSVTQETQNTFTLALESLDGRPLPHRPGQFMFLKLGRPGRPSEEHPFTISSSPTGEPPTTATIKQSGDFTNTIGLTRPGDTARVQGPYGRFSFVHQEAPGFIFIAGGAGITPIMSMLRYLRDTGDTRPAVLIYGSRTEADIIFRTELERMRRNLRVVHVLSDAPAGCPALRGRVDRRVIQENAAELIQSAHVYLCGPPPMMESVLAALRELGVADRRIHYERFAI